MTKKTGVFYKKNEKIVKNDYCVLVFYFLDLGQNIVVVKKILTYIVLFFCSINLIEAQEQVEWAHTDVTVLTSHSFDFNEYPNIYTVGVNLKAGSKILWNNNNWFVYQFSYSIGDVRLSDGRSFKYSIFSNRNVQTISGKIEGYVKSGSFNGSKTNKRDVDNSFLALE